MWTSLAPDSLESRMLRGPSLTWDSPSVQSKEVDCNLSNMRIFYWIIESR